MTNQSCNSCGQLFLPGTEPWAVVDPDRPQLADWLCGECERAFEASSQVFVFTDRRWNVATLLSDCGLRAARHDAMKRHAA